jgi:hypothetical protein
MLSLLDPGGDTREEMGGGDAQEGDVTVDGDAGDVDLTAFVFADVSADTVCTEDVTTGCYARVDRMGMPAVSTALIPSGPCLGAEEGSPSCKDVYNAGDPAGDAAFLGDPIGVYSVLTCALSDDLAGFGLAARSSKKATAPRRGLPHRI